MSNEELDLARACTTGKLELICSEMQLLRCPDYSDSVLSGNGIIRSDDRGRLSFRLIAPSNTIPSIAGRSGRPHGELHETEDLVMLRAVDHVGREWRSNWFLAEATPPNQDSNIWQVSHSIETLLYSRSRPTRDNSAGRVYLPMPPGIPFDTATGMTRTVGENVVESGWSIDHHERSIGGARVEFREEAENWLTVRAEQSTPVMPDWPGLICQALSFATAQTARPVVVIREFNTRIDTGVFAGPHVYRRTPLTPPLIGAEAGLEDHFWMIIQTFFEWADSKAAILPRLLEELAGIRNGAGGSMQTAALTLAVGVESIAGILLENISVERDEKEEASIKSLLKHVKDWSGDPKVCSRATSILGALNAVRTVDRIYAFGRLNNIPGGLIAGWKKLRDTTAHGKVAEPDQRVHDHYYSTVELLYRIIAATIGYKGPISETSRRGWGIDEWGFPAVDNQSSKRCGRRPDDELAAMGTTVLEHVRSNPGQRLEEIGRALGEPTKGLKRPVAKLLSAGLLRTEGQKRSTKYFVGSGAKRKA